MNNIQIITVTQRFARTNVEYASNDLATMMPDIGASQVADLMSLRPIWSEDERMHDDETRMSYVMRLGDFVFAMPIQVDAATAIFRKLDRASHRHWGVRAKGATTFQALVSSIAAGTYQPAVGGVLGGATNVCVLIGTPGTGKSTTVEQSILRFAQGVFFHPSSAIYQVLAIRVKVLKGGSVETVAESIFKQLVRHAAATGVPIPWRVGKVPPSHARVVEAIGDMLELLHVGCVIVEELQHLFLGTEATDRKVVAFITTLVNLAPTLFCFIGSWELMPLLGLEERLGRRSAGDGFFQFRRMQDAAEVHAFMTAMWPLQWTRKHYPLTPEISAEFSYQTLGIHDYLVKLYMLCQTHLIALEKFQSDPVLNVALIREICAVHFPTLAPAIQMMRAGRKETDRTLWDTEPKDMAQYLSQYRRHVLHRKSGDRVVAFLNPGAPAPAPSAAPVGKTPTGSQAPAAGDTPAEAPPASASLAAAPAPDPSAPTARGEATDPQSPRKPRRLHLRPLSTVKANAERDAQFQALGDDDLRKLYYFARQRSEPLVDALARQGHLRIFSPGRPPA